MSWNHFKSLPSKGKTWKTEMVMDDKKADIQFIMFQNVLKRCGRFLTQLHLWGLDDHDKRIITTVAQECQNLRVIDLAYHRVSRECIQTISTIFSNVKKFKLYYLQDDVNDEDLAYLFSLNKVLEHLTIRFSEYHVVKGNFLDTLSCDTIKELNLSGVGSISFDIICCVSMIN